MENEMLDEDLLKEVRKVYGSWDRLSPQRQEEIIAGLCQSLTNPTFRIDPPDPVKR